MDLEEGRSGEREEGVDSDIVEFCCVQQRETQSESFRVALEKITTLASSLRGDKPGMEVMIPVRVLYQARQPFSAIGDRPVEDLATAARAERRVKEQWEPSSEMESGSLQCVFVLEPMIADFANLAVNADMIETLSALVSDDMWFSRVTLYLRLDPKLKADHLLAKTKFGQLVSSVFDSTRHSPQLASTKYYSDGVSLQLGTVAVYCYNSLTSLEFEALCSAMVTNQTTKRLSLSLWLDPKDASSSATRWKWLAYALFSKRARACSALRSLTLASIGSMSVADMEAFAAVVMSEHPKEELFGTSCGQINGRNAIFIQGPTMCRSSDETGRTLKLELPTSSVRTFSDDGQSEWVDVVIPGHGRCLVRRNNLIFRPDPGENQGGISSLTIGFSDFNAQALNGLMNFLAAVGPSLRVLALDAMRIDFDVNFIIQCCPNMEELSLRSLVTDVRFDFKEWHESCQSPPTLRTDWSDVISISTELQDNDSPFTKSLRRLRVRLNNVRDSREVHDNARINSSVAEMLRMLDVNQTLEYLDVITPSEYRVFFDNFRGYHLKPICRSSPLQMKSKVAFLSIFFYYRTHNETHNQLKPRWVTLRPDQHVLDEIFQFAAAPVLRQVYFRELDWIDKYNEVPI
ncbi:hypothetical protein PI124_g6735 [Phytophthora idaei]|nr:hypothetical protein PI125_g17226 [Phytophthora idaei]KAG3155988.1 hypothetical protein PI126_g8936 [Phytophthora idaei]KAG3248568.1 hypothetical protein PI124_g6735 [Phytophthora idaei]